MSILRAGVARQSIAIATLGLALSACSGPGTSTPTPTPTPPANHAPVITSEAGINVDENVIGTFGQVTATDADGNPVTFSLSGADAARFMLSSTGGLSFVSSPNFERPLDADGDNIYTVQLSASDGITTVGQTLSIRVLNSKEGITAQRVATGFNHPVAIVNIPGMRQLMVAERSGAIYMYDPGNLGRTLWATVDGLTNDEGQGILSIAVQPDFSNRHTVYALIAHGNNSVAVRQIYTVGSQVGWLEYAIGAHNPYSSDVGGWMGFGADGRLYVATEDAGGANDPTGSAQSPGSRFGKLLSFSPAAFDAFSGASVPPPIVPTVLASGLHNPVGGVFYSGGLLLPDRGQSLREEVNLLPLAPGALDNLGWPYREGTVVNLTGEPAGLVPPVLEYPHGTGTYAGQRIVGGLVYQGVNVSLAGTYLFVDASGAIFTAPLTSLVRGTTVSTNVFERRDLDFTPVNGAMAQPVSVVLYSDGVIYIACDNGDIIRVAAN